MGRLKKRLLPRRELLARKYSIVNDEFNYPQEHYKEFLLEDANYQPETGLESYPSREGSRDKKSYKVFTSTIVDLKNNTVPTVHQEEETPTGVRYQVYVDGFWCDVVDSKPWSYGVQSHNVLTVVERNER